MQAAVVGLILALHVAGGAAALLAGPVAMAARKGGSLHRASGRLYAAAMACTAVSALFLAVAARNRLLLVIAVFSFFLVFTGWRALDQRRLHEGIGARWFDWVVAALTLLFSAGLLASGLATGRDITTLFFGVLGCALAAGQMRKLAGWVQPGSWMVRHMIGMSAAYIATVSAFAVVTLAFLPQPVAFIAPTLVGTPMIAWAVVRLKAARGRGKAAGPAAAATLLPGSGRHGDPERFPVVT